MYSKYSLHDYLYRSLYRDTFLTRVELGLEFSILLARNILSMRACCDRGNVYFTSSLTTLKHKKTAISSSLSSRNSPFKMSISLSISLCFFSQVVQQSTKKIQYFFHSKIGSCCGSPFEIPEILNPEVNGCRILRESTLIHILNVVEIVLFLVIQTLFGIRHIPSDLKVLDRKRVNSLLVVFPNLK